MMEVILLERIERLGQMGDTVRVRPGFARNFLLPQKKAMRATKENKAIFEAQRAELEARNAERRRVAEQAAEAMDGVSVVLIRQAGASGQLYGSVSARDIADALKAKGHEADKSQVQIEDPIKSLGLFTVRLSLHPEVRSEITVNVARSEAEAETQQERGGMVTADMLEAEELEAERAAEEAARLAALEAADANEEAEQS